MATVEERLSALEARVDRLDGGTVLATPTNVRVVYDPVTKKATTSWGAVAGASAYEVYGGTAGTVLPRVGTVAGLSRLSGVLTQGTTYEYAVAAISSTGTTKSPLSARVSVTAAATQPPTQVLTPTPIGSISEVPNPTLSTPPPVTPPPVGNVKYPADLLGGNSQWKVTLPTSTGGKVTEIKPPEFGTFSHEKYFFLNAAKDGVVCRVWHGGDTTQNSKNPRTELRERFNNDPEGYWNPTEDKTRTMEVTLQVNRLTKVKPHTVIAQIHDDADDTVVWRLEANQLWLTDGNTTHGHLVDGNYKLGDKHTLKYVVTKGGVYNFWYDGVKVPYTKTYPRPSYFKTGAYLQSNPEKVPTESTSEYTEVVIYKVKVTHS